ncbi:MAG: PKD domain-containing protein [Rhodocyclales bacterium]|nr:PKD domain-containing protein [Rhodocyclales bacterium]
MNRIAASVLIGGYLAGWLWPLAAPAEDGPSAAIGAENLCTNRAVKIVSLYAKTAGLTPPLSYHWNLGNGKEWSEAEVPEQEYDVGRYDVVLAVKDGAGRVRKASMAIDSESQGCGVMR